MRLVFFLFFSIIDYAFASAQYKVIIRINSLPSQPATENIYLAGNFNNWNPRDEKLKLQKDADGKWIIVIQSIPASEYEFKFTRGAWETVETTADGRQIANRSLKLMSDTTLNLDIDGWSEGKPRDIPHTANGRVSILDSAFYIPQLDRHRRIWLYLPKGYSSGKQCYPVLYMHDGQNLFDEATSFAGEWGIE